MARHPFSPRAGRKNRTRTYSILLAVLALGVLIAFYYGPFGKNEAGIIDKAPQSDTNINIAAANKTEVPNEPQIKEPVVTKKPEVNEPVAVVPPAETEKKVELPQVTQEPEPGPAVDANPEASTLISEAATLLGEKPSKIIEARDKLNQALRMPMSPQQRTSVKDQLSKLSDQWLFSRTVVPEDPLCESYQVKFGDTLENIGKKFKVPYEFLMTINRISDARTLQAGLPIKVIKGPFNAKIYRSNFTMDVYLQNTFVRSFRVGLGKDKTETPTGIWRVKADGKLEKPPWPDPVSGKILYPEDPEYPLGSRWIGLEGLSGEAKDRTGFGIHGTKDPETIGNASSQGCIRMHNGDAILVYNMLFPGVSQVEIRD
jgi:LysM repeat protein